MTRIYAEVSLKKLIDNLSQIRKGLSPNCQPMAIVKADAYGHGAIEIATELQKNGIKQFGVASIEEGVELRKAGIKELILVLSEPSIYEKVSQFFDYNLTPCVYSREFVEVLAAYDKNISVQVKFNTGMNRLGVNYDEAESFLQFVLASNLQISGIFTHFACADEVEMPLNELQQQRFLEINKVAKKVVPDALLHCSNSAATMNFPAMNFDIVRLGINLYKDVMSVCTYVNYVRELSVGDMVSYGAMFTADKDMKIAIVSAGYADGVNRLLSNNGFVLIKGKRCPIVGLVCMDLLMVDVSDIVDISRGEKVTIIGNDGSENISAEEIATSLGTIDYEILCGISKRVVRKYV